MNSSVSDFGDSRRDSWLEYLSTLDWNPGFRDASSWSALLRAGSLRVDPDLAIEEVAKRITATGGTLNPGKLKQQQQRAFQRACNDAIGQQALVKPQKLKFDPDKLKSVAAKAPDVDVQWIARHSPIPPTEVTSRQFLEHLYLPGEKVVIFSVFESQGQCVYEVGGAWQPPLPDGGPNGVWFLANPVDGQEHPNPRLNGKLSRRSEESVTSWRYLVLENDEAPEVEWLAALVQLPLRIAAIYTSGGKSIHALVRIDAATKADWDAKCREIKPVVVTLGADESALTAVRLSRLPGARRAARLQELLYLDPEPTSISTFRKATL